MTDPHSTTSSESHDKPSAWHSWVDRVIAMIRREPEDKDDILALLELALERNLIDANAYSIAKGAMTVSEMTAGDIMVPRARMHLLDVNRPLSELLPQIVESGHSRFPVYEGSKENIIGIFITKDILRQMLNPRLTLRDLLRPATFIPEYKRVNVLLQEFRTTRNHIAIVVDEHGGITGLVTLEDVLEQIVGEIEDEFDASEQTIFPDGHNTWRIMAETSLASLENFLGCTFEDGDYETLGGWMTHELGHIPRRGDRVALGTLQFEVLRADDRRALWVRVRKLTETGLVANTSEKPV